MLTLVLYTLKKLVLINVVKEKIEQTTIMSKTNCTKQRSAMNTTNKQTQESCKTQQPKNKLNFTDAELNTTLLTLDFISMLQHDKFTGTPIYREIHRVRKWRWWRLFKWCKHIIGQCYYTEWYKVHKSEWPVVHHSLWYFSKTLQKKQLEI